MQLVHFFKRHVMDIRKEGLPALFRKSLVLLKKICDIPLVLLAMPLVLFIRLLHPFVLIRFGKLISSRIGHFAGNTELYLCERDISKTNKQVFDIFCYGKPICNQQLKKMWERTGLLHISSVARWLDKANRLIPGGRKHRISLTDRDRYGLVEQMPIRLSFTPDEEKLGQDELRRLGIPDNNNPFICFHARSPLYLKTQFQRADYSYHDYRDSDIHDYIPAVEELVRRGYFAIRMGALVKETLNTANAGIIDYTVKGRTEFLDIYLAAKCCFFLGDTAGLHAVPMLFRRPVVLVNFITLEYVQAWREKNLFIPKKLWLCDEHRYLSFREVIELGIGRTRGIVNHNGHEQLGIEIIDNTSEEIKAVVVEMEERLNGKWQTTEEDEELQRHFWSLFKPDDLNQIFVTRIGTEFLRQNRELLG